MKKFDVKFTGKTKKTALSIGAVVLAGAVIAGVVFGVRGRGEPVGVYPFAMVGMTEFWGDNQESYGPVTTDRIQTVFLSDTQTVTDVLVKQGDSVKKGDVLMTYDTTLSELQLERKRLDVEKAKLQVTEAEEELRKIINMTPAGGSGGVLPGGEKEYGKTIEEHSEGDEYYVYPKNTNDGSSPEKPVILWLAQDRPLDRKILDTVYRKAMELQKENTGSVSSASAEPKDMPEKDPALEEPSETTAPTETTAPPETTVPPETTAPDETTQTEPAAEPTTPTAPAVVDRYQAEMATLLQTAPTSIRIINWDVSGGTFIVRKGNAVNLYFTTNITDPIHKKYVEWEVLPKEQELEIVDNGVGSIILSGKPTVDKTYTLTARYKGATTVSSAPYTFTLSVQEPVEEPVWANEFFMVLRITQEDRLLAPKTTWQGVRVTAYDGGGYGFRLYDAAVADPMENDSDSSTPTIDFGSGMTAAEIAKLRREQEKKVKELTATAKMTESEYNLMVREFSDGNIRATLDGEVVSLLTEEESRENKQPMLKVSGGGGFYVEGSVSELEKDNLKPGQEVTVNDWNTGMTYSGEVKSIGDFPETGNGWNGMGNPTASYYPFRVFIDGTADLQEGGYVSVTYSKAEAENGIYLENPFLRTENGESYVYVRGENGKLEKRVVTTGKSLWGSYTEIRSGLTADDYVAFPYGKTVKPGAATQESDLSALYGY